MNEQGMWEFFTHVFNKLTGWHENQLAAIQTTLDKISETQEKNHLATQEQFDAVFARLSAAEDKLAVYVAGLKSQVENVTAQNLALQEQIKGLGLSAEVEAAVIAKLEAQAADFEAMVPVVVAPPAEEPVVEQPATPEVPPVQ